MKLHFVELSASPKGSETIYRAIDASGNVLSERKTMRKYAAALVGTVEKAEDLDAWLEKEAADPGRLSNCWGSTSLFLKNGLGNKYWQGSNHVWIFAVTAECKAELEKFGIK